MQFRFENDDVLWALLLLFGWIALSLWQRWRSPGGFSPRRLLLSTSAFALCILALARPQMGHYAPTQRALRSNLFLAIDISKSMLAEDVTPSRLGFVGAFARRLLESLPGVRVALFPFASDGYLQMPLSTDIQAANDLIASLNPSMMTSQGTDYNTSLETLLDVILAMQQRVRDNNGDWAPTQVVLLSDGESHRSITDSLLKRYRGEHIPIFTVGIGTTEGGFIPVDARFGAGRESLRDREGRTVRTRLEADSLRAIARATEGDYFPSKFESVYPLARRLTQSMQLGRLTATFKAERELFPYLLLAALALFALEVGLGRWEYALRVLVPLALLIGGGHARAMSEETQGKLEKAGANRGIEAYNLGVQRLEQGNVPEATELFAESAQSTKDSSVRKRALYNLGNSLMKLGDPTQALAAYQLALDTKADSAKLEKEANQRISDNIVLAVKMEQEQRRQQKEKQQGEGNDEPKDGQDDPKGPKQFQSQQFDEQQKQRMFDLVSGEEQQVLQRLQSKKNSKKPQNPPNGKEW